jgi:hypothetical protein
MIELDELIRQHELRSAELIGHLRQIRGTPEAEVEGLYVLALLEDLAMLKGEHQRRQDLLEQQRAA